MTAIVRGHWFRIANHVVDHHAPKVGAMGLAVYCGLARYANVRTRRCYPSLTLLAQKLATSRRHLILAIRRLEAAGLIAVTRARGKGNQYQLLPRPAAPATILAESTSRSSAELVSQRNGTRSSLSSPPVPQRNTNKTHTTRLKEQGIEVSAHSTVKRLIKQLEEETGYPVTNWGKETRILQSLLQRETEADVLSCLDWLASDRWWSQRKLSYAVVADQIAFYKAKVRGRHQQTKGGPYGIHREGARRSREAPHGITTYTSGELGRFVEL